MKINREIAMWRTLIIISAIFTILISCSETNKTNVLSNAYFPIDTTEYSPPIDTGEVDSNRIFITDRTGKKWDITHAVNNYGFKSDRFQYGLGPNAIKPINNPDFVVKGEDGFPGPSEPMTVIGTTIRGDTRAYSLRDLSSHEIANDSFEELHVAVGY